MGLQEKKFAFDIELLLKAELRKQESIARIPIAWIDSEAASTTADIQPYLPMLKSITGMYRQYLSRDDRAEEFATFIDTLDDEKWARLIANVPTAIDSREPDEFSTFAGVSVAELKKRII